MGSIKNRHSKRAEGKIFAQNNKYEGRNIFKKFGHWLKKLRIWQKCLIAFLILLITAGIVVANIVSSKLNLLNKVTVDETKLSIVDVDGYANILLLGVDTRDMDTIKGSRSDAIMIISINEKTKDVKLISVYRDTYLQMGSTTTYDKITHACVYGGPEMTVKSLNQAMDLDISKFVVVNFKAVADLVDSVGGIEVNVENYEIQQLNKYTIQTAHNIGEKKYNLVKKEGIQNLAGVQAVSYGRIRKGVGDDYKRTERMRIVLTKVFEKIKVMKISDLNKICNMMLPQCQTNLSNSDIIALGVRAATYNITESVGWPYNVTSSYLNKVSYVFPNNLESNILKLHEEIFLQSDYKVSDKAKTISNNIIARIAADAAAKAAAKQAVIDKVAAAKQAAIDKAAAEAAAKAEKVVPNLIGLTQEAAETMVTAAGLTIGTVTGSTATKDGLVTGQSLVAGTKQKAGTVINITVNPAS